jgi:DNA-binding CsgD family transcriptional regulator
MRHKDMKHFDLAQSFIERCGNGEDAETLAAAFQHVLETLGFRHFACCSHVDPLLPPPRAVMLHTYPAEWARTFSELQFYDVDPVFEYANRTLLPFFWDTALAGADLTMHQQEILAEARRFGLVHGYTVPIHSPWSQGVFRASCSVVPDSQSIEPAAYSAVQLMSTYLYELASRDAASGVVVAAPSELSQRERQCLELAAQGKTDWVVGKILGISERTVHNHIENAKRRLRVATRVQAVVHALASRQISFGDVIRAEQSERSGPINKRRNSRP